MEGLQLSGDLRADQYGVRLAVRTMNMPPEIPPLKIEFIAEARIVLDPPETPLWSPIPCLTVADSITEKLLSNADRGDDTATNSRDAIDLAALRFHNRFPRRAFEKAAKAYGNSTITDALSRAVLRLRDDQGYRARCFERLEVRNQAMIMEGLERLSGDIEAHPFSDDDFAPPSP